MVNPRPPYIIVVPCFNGGDLLGRTLTEVRAFGHPVVVVDDGSSDNTSAAANEQNVSLVCHETNRGKGAALRTGFTWARQQGFRSAITMDADGQHDPAALPNLIAAYEKDGYHILVGSRFTDRTKKAETPWIRHLSNTLSTDVIRLVAGVRVDDIQCGYRIYDLEALDALHLEHTGFAFETEVLAKAARQGLRLGSVPIPCRYPDGTRRSHYRAVADSWEIAKVVWRARFGSKNGNSNNKVEGRVSVGGGNDG